MNKQIGVKILDTTLRDGSYAINFSFTCADVMNICRALEDAGVRWIEIGHGVGLRASLRGFGRSVHTDEEYMRVAQKSLRKSSYGMFCIPGIARVDDITKAADHGMGFIRIGTNVDAVCSSKRFIKRAKEANMFVAANFMKSYASSPDEFAENVLRSADYGADVVYIVDSAGGMFIEDIRHYIEAIRRVSSIALGFHGHDNLGMAVANSIEAVRMGIEFVDSSLQGLGRSSGNASTEILSAAFTKIGINTGADFIKLCDAGQKFIQPLLVTKGKRVLDIVSGYADFHSSYMHYIQKYSTKYGVDPARLIIEYSKINKVNVVERELNRVAQKVRKANELYSSKYDFMKYVEGEQDERRI